MSRGLSGTIGISLLAVVATGTAAYAQDAPGGSPAPAPSAAPADTAAPAPAASSSAAPSSGKGLTGYAPMAPRSAPPTSSLGGTHHRHLLPHHADEAVATFVGFEMLADGGSRLFVRLTRQVDVASEKMDLPASRKGKKVVAGDTKAAVVSRLKFVLKGTEIVNPLNEGHLVMVHFNTPVVRSNFEPAGKNLSLVVALRADVTPEVKFVPAKDNGSILQIDFPQGSYLPEGAEPAAPNANGADGNGTAAPAAAGDKAPGSGQ